MEGEDVHTFVVSHRVEDPIDKLACIHQQIVYRLERLMHLENEMAEGSRSKMALQTIGKEIQRVIQLLYQQNMAISFYASKSMGVLKENNTQLMDVLQSVQLIVESSEDASSIQNALTVSSLLSHEHIDLQKAVMSMTKIKPKQASIPAIVFEEKDKENIAETHSSPSGVPQLIRSFCASRSSAPLDKEATYDDTTAAKVPSKRPHPKAVALLIRSFCQNLVSQSPQSQDSDISGIQELKAKLQALKQNRMKSQSS